MPPDLILCPKCNTTHRADFCEFMGPPYRAPPNEPINYRRLLRWQLETLAAGGTRRDAGLE